MAVADAEYVTDPLSPACWVAQPTIRRLQYAFDDLSLVPRLALQFPTATAPDGEADESPGSRATAAIRGSGMPVDDLWTDGRPSSRPACAAVAFVRDAAPERVHAYLHRVREAVFVTREPVDSVDGLRSLAEEVGGIDAGAVSEAVRSGRADTILVNDLERLAALARDVEAGSVDVRGTVDRLPIGPRFDALGVERHAPDDDGEEADGDGAEGAPSILAPPAVRFRTDDGVVVADPRIGYQRLAAVLGRAIPPHVATMNDKYGTGRLAMHLPQDVAEALSSREFVDEVRSYVTRFERVYLAEVAAGTGRSPETCRGSLEALSKLGVVEPVSSADGWRMIEEGGPPASNG